MQLTEVQELIASLPKSPPSYLKYRGKNLKTSEVKGLLYQIPKLIGWEFAPYEKKVTWSEEKWPAYRVALGVTPVTLCKMKHIFLLVIGAELEIYINAHGFSHRKETCWANHTATVDMPRTFWSSLYKLWNSLDGKSAFAEILSLSKKQPDPVQVQEQAVINNKPAVNSLQGWNKHLKNMPSKRQLDLT